MRTTLKRGLAGAMALSAVASLAPIIAASPAAALATDNVAAGGTISITGNTSGGPTTTFGLSLTESGGASPTCPGDGPAGYRWSTFIIPASSSVSQLVFGPTGTVNAVAGEFRNNLYSGTTAVRGRNPDIAVATISGIPGMQYNIYASSIPAGAYQIGIACHTTGGTLNDVYDYWSTPVTITQTGGVFAYSAGIVPPAPTISGVTPGDGSLQVAFTQPTSVPPVSTYTLTATPQGGGAAVTQTGAGSPLTISGLVNGTTYDLSLTGTNSVGTSTPATATGTPAPAPRAPVTGFTATPATGEVALAWTTPIGVAPTGYELVITPTAPAGAALPTVTLPAGTTSYTATGLTAGTTYSFNLTPLHPSPYTAPSSTLSATPLAAQVLLQDITVTRPVGALVLTQVCGAYGALAAEGAQLGFPSGLPAASAFNSSTVASPNLATAGIPTNENPTSYSQYPYPTNPDGTANATYPTRCGINLGNAQFVRSGAGAGQFFAADGRLNQVTVVDTRDADTGWNVVGQVSDFTAGPGKSFSGSQLGWVPVKTEDTGSFVDSLGNSYDQVAAAGGAIAPNTAVASGLSSNRTLINANGAVTSAPGVTTGGLGTAIADARLKLLIPITAQAGTYTAVLTISTL